MDPSIHRLWAGYLFKSGQPLSVPLPAVWHFCDNELDADECVGLVLKGRKSATAPPIEPWTDSWMALRWTTRLCRWPR